MKLRRTGYTITIQGLYYAMQRMKIYQITSRENFWNNLNFLEKSDNILNIKKKGEKYLWNK